MATPICVIYINHIDADTMNKKVPWELIILKLKNEITDDQNFRLVKWLSEDENKKIFDELHEVWENVQSSVSGYVPDKNYYWEKLSAQMNVTKKKTSRKIIPITSIYRYSAVACVILAVFITASFLITKSFHDSRITTQTYSTLGGKSKITLPDGTVVWLNSNTTLSYETDFRETDRSVKITGEAYFDVTKDKKRPFIVKTDGVEIIVHGTKFDVEALPNNENIFVSLVNGAVSLKTATENRALYPGEIATFSKKRNQLSIRKGNVEFVKSWANDKIIFKNKSLEEICRFLSRWYGVNIKIDPALSQKQYYTFTLQNEPLEEVLRIMARINAIEYRFDENNRVNISRKIDVKP